MNDGIVTRLEVEAANRRIHGYVRSTPLVALEGGAFGSHGRLFLKLESMQHSGSFKSRGAFNRMLTAKVPAQGVITASGGNHGAAVAYAAHRLGHHAEVFVPGSSPQSKVEKIRGFGANITVKGESYADAVDLAEKRACESEALFVHAYDDREVVAGQGTVAAEISALQEIDTILVAVGGGGLIGGVAAWYGDDARIVAVEPELAPTLQRALNAGKPVDVEVGGIAASALGARRIGHFGYTLAERFVKDSFLVPDAAIVSAQKALWDNLRLLVEPGGATALSALLTGLYTPQIDERVCIVVCGANTDVHIQS